MANPSITPQNAVLLAAVAYLSTPVQEIGQYLPGWKIVWNGIETTDGNYAFIATDATNSVYAFAVRGSLPPFDIFKNWDAFANWVIEDLDVITRVSWSYSANSGALIANGTNTAFNNIQAMVDSFGSGQSAASYLHYNAVANNIPVMIAGHSLGGNIANIFSSYFVTAIAAHHNFTQTYLYTFAAPAAGNEAYATDLDTKLPNAWHYDNDNDIIPKFPVFDRVLLVAFLYIPSPAASQISVMYKNITITLREGFIALAAVLEFYGYRQQANNYIIFPNGLSSQYMANTFSDYIGQVGYQHGLGNYASYLGVVLPLEAVIKSRGE
ncbi:MAG TPA: lipase family protein [Chitinophagaceae bacterium]|nr:lipase family protein [Chitinophagaceae bacterium]